MVLLDTGEVYATGPTSSPDFPTTTGAYQTTLNGNSDAFIIKMNADGTALIASTLVGGSGLDEPWTLAISDDGKVALWVGNLEDLWKLGVPRGEGGPWRDAAVRAGAPSDPYLMTGYDRKTVRLSHDRPADVRFTIEVDFLADGTWHPYETVTVPAGKTVTHAFPAGFAAHWVRVKADADCKATAWFVYNM
jgi:hypothetical protein